MKEESAHRSKSYLRIVVIGATLLVLAIFAIWYFSHSATLLVTTDYTCDVFLDDNLYTINPGDTLVVNLSGGEYEIAATEKQYEQKIVVSHLVSSRWATDTIALQFREILAEEEAITTARTEKTIAAYKNYLSLFPKGNYSQEATRQIEALTGQMDSAQIALDSTAYAQAVQRGTLRAFEAYIVNFPKGIYVSEATKQLSALKKIDQDAFESAKTQNTIVAYEAYIKKFPDGLFVRQARNLIDYIEKEEEMKVRDKELFDLSKRKNTLVAYQFYLEEFPKGLYVREANRMIDQLLQEADAQRRANEDPVWKITQSKGNIDSYEKYLKDYPDGRYVNDAREILTSLYHEKEMQAKAPPGMMYVEGGMFNMGSSKGKGDESPEHKVLLSSFYMSRFEVTNEQFATFLNSYGSNYVKKGAYAGQDMVFEDEWGLKKDGGKWVPQPGKETYPAVYVTWYGANEYCKFYNYRLPTEAEWEFAARGGTRSKNFKYSGSNDPDNVAWFYENANSTNPVGQKNPNELGIFDLTGNVWEWCADWHDRSYYSVSPGKNPKGPGNGTVKVLRGGSFFEMSSKLRTTYRDFSYPVIGDFKYGFRCVKDVAE